MWSATMGRRGFTRGQNATAVLQVEQGAIKSKKKQKTTASRFMNVTFVSNCFHALNFTVKGAHMGAGESVCMHANILLTTRVAEQCYPISFLRKSLWSDDEKPDKQRFFFLTQYSAYSDYYTLISFFLSLIVILKGKQTAIKWINFK